MDRFLTGLFVISVLALAGCAGASGSSDGPNVVQQLNELNQMPQHEGNVGLDFSRVDSVDNYYMTPLVSGGSGGVSSVTTTNDETSDPSNGPTTTTVVGLTPPVTQHYARVAGIANLTVANANKTTTDIKELGSSAVFSTDTATGAACLTAAQAALNGRGELDIQGHGYIVQIPYTYCPPEAMCETPEPISNTDQFIAGFSLTSDNETNAVLSSAVTTSIQITLPIWIYAHVGVFFDSITNCDAMNVSPQPSPSAAPISN